MNPKFLPGRLVRRCLCPIRGEFEKGPYTVKRVVITNDGVTYTIARGGDSVTDFPEDMLKGADEFNDRDVPYHEYAIRFANGSEVSVDVGDVDQWCNIQPCTPGDCDDWGDAIGYGNDADGHAKITKVTDMEDGSTWEGNNAIRSWYASCVSEYTEKYSD